MKTATGTSNESGLRSGPCDLLLSIPVGVICAVLAWFRLPSAARDTIWAEDGPIFLHPWAVGAGWSSVLAPYDGYLHVVPRLLGGLVYVSIGVDGYANMLIALCCISYGVVAGLVFFFARDVIALPEARVMLALVTVLAPVAGWESMHNLANLHWFLLWLTPWLLLARARTRVGLVLMTVLAVLIALTEVQSVVFAPLVFWLWRRRTSWPILAAFVLGLAAQAAAVLLSPRVRPETPGPPLSSTVAGYLLNNGIAFWDSRPGHMAFVLQKIGWWAGLFALIPFVVAFGIAFWKGDRQVRIAAVALSMASVVGWTVAFMVNHDPDYYYTRLPIDGVHLRLVRWATATSMFVIAAIPLMVSVVVGRWPRCRWWGAGLLAAACLVMSTSFVQNGHARNGQKWHTAVSDAATQCMTDPDHMADIPIQPTNWGLILPCSLLDAG